jgi:hypothetical protein
MKTKEEQLQFIINSNPTLFGLRFKDYIDGKIVLTEPSENAIKTAERDYELFQKCQEAIYQRTTPAMGDWVELEDGRFERITVHLGENTLQVGGTFGGSFYIYDNGRCSYSGGCGDPIKREEIVPTDNYKEGQCWLFSDNWPGANRGVYNILRFKVWKQHKRG